MDTIDDLEYRLDTLEGRILDKMNNREVQKLKQKLLNVLVSIEEIVRCLVSFVTLVGTWGNNERETLQNT